MLDAKGGLSGVETGHGYRSHDGGLGLVFLALRANFGDGLLQVGDGTQDLGLSFRSLGLFGGDFHTQLLGDSGEGSLEGGVVLGGFLFSLELCLVGVEGALAVDFVILCDDLLLLFSGERLVGEFGLKTQLLGHGLQPGNKFLHYSVKFKVLISTDGVIWSMVCFSMEAAASESISSRTSSTDFFPSMSPAAMASCV